MRDQLNVVKLKELKVIKTRLPRHRLAGLVPRGERDAVPRLTRAEIRPVPRKAAELQAAKEDLESGSAVGTHAHEFMAQDFDVGDHAELVGLALIHEEAQSHGGLISRPNLRPLAQKKVTKAEDAEAIAPKPTP